MVGSANQGRDSVYKLVEEKEFQDLNNYNCFYDERKLIIYNISEKSTAEEWIESSYNIDISKDVAKQLEEERDDISPTD